MISSPYAEKRASAYQVSPDVAEFTSIVQKDYARGDEILNKPSTELNNRSVIDDMNRGQRMFNAFVDEDIEDPAEAWKWRGTRSMARNKGIGMHAQLTAAMLIPGFSAQNEQDEIDRDFSNVMRDIVEWMTLPQNSDYQSSFVSLVIGMIESPVVYLGAEYREVMQKIKERTEQGYTTKEVLDEVLSGYKAPVFSADQILISNAYERNIQKHRFIVKRRYIEYGEAEALYSEHENWVFVQPGIKSIYADEGLFYDVKDDDHPQLVAEEIYLNRRDDTEVCFLNGIYMGASNVDANPIRHRDNRGTPKYNVIPFGYHRIGQHYFYYKSMMNAVGWDNLLYDAMSEVIMNNAILEQDPPTAVSGSDKVDTDINFPGAVVAFADKDTRAQAIFPPKNFAVGFQALMATKDSIDDATLSDTQMGQLPQAEQKAYTVAQAQANAKKMLAGTAKSLAESVTAYGPLMADIALNHLTVPQIDEITGGGTRMKYRKFILEKQMMDGKEVSKEILFDEALIGKELSKKEVEGRSLKLLTEIGYPDHKKHVFVVNPHLFSKLRYLCRIDPEEMFPKSAETMQAMLVSLYQLLAADPYIEAEPLRRELLNSYFRGRADDFMKEAPLLPVTPEQAPTSPMAEQIRQKQASGILQNVGVQ